MKYFKLFKSVKIIKGFNRSLIFDSTKNLIRFIPNDLFDLLNAEAGFNISKQKADSTEKNKITIDDYLNFLISNNFGFYCNSLCEFRSFEYKVEDFNLPFDLSYLIIDLSDDSIFDINILKQIIDCRIMYLEIRFCHDVTISYFEDILKKCLILNNSFVNEISFIIKFNNDLYDFLKNNNLGINKFLNIQFHSCSYDSNSQLDNVMFTFTSNKLSIPLSCGIIRKNNFVYSNNFYLESQNHNTCLNKKISIDKDGNIKNCPSMKNIYGNIRNTTLGEVLIIPEFRSFWKINKNEIDVCRDCEFRHICTDCRAYIENPANIYSKPLKCGYDPYTNLWTEWSTNPLKATVIEEYNLQTIINPS